MYWALAFFGPNLVITEGDDWKRHRKVVQSSFSENAYPLVWQRTKSSAQHILYASLRRRCSSLTADPPDLAPLCQ
jgi:cytochrome P450